MKSFTGTAGQQRIHKDYLANCLFPLPPLSEQERIVEKLEQLLPLCERLKWGIWMKDLDRKVKLLCPLCGNDQFESLDEEFEDLLHASDDVRLRCSDCGSEYTKRELIDSNAAIIDTAVDELKQDAVREIEKELKKAMKKWKIWLSYYKE